MGQLRCGMVQVSKCSEYLGSSQSSAECIGCWALCCLSGQDQKKKKQEEKGNKEPLGFPSKSSCYGVSEEHLSLAQHGPSSKSTVRLARGPHVPS